jgi:MoaA/NifB/PqqE/SkfB family radical SAM enzyme
MELPLYRAYRTLRAPVLPPLQISMAVTWRCRYQCPTCHCAQKAADNELTDQEYYRFFNNLKFRPFLITLTGGEPMLRTDILKIAALVGQVARPVIMCMETAGVLPDRALRCFRLLTERYRDTHFIAMLSLPGVHGRLDELRGAPPRTGAFETFLKTYRALRSINAPNYSIGVDVLLSRFNAADINAVMDYAFLMYPDVVKLTVAHGSECLGISTADAAPPRKEHDDTVAHYIQKSLHTGGRNVHRAIWRVLRAQSRRAARNLHVMAQSTACHAAFGSIFITPDGAVLDCPVAAREMGALRDHALDLDLLLCSDRARMVRKQVAAAECFCPMQYADFTHALTHTPTYLRMTASSL